MISVPHDLPDMLTRAMDHENAAAQRDSLRAELRAKLRDSLRAARDVFAPELTYGRHLGPPAVDARRASVLVLLMPMENGWSIPLTVRPDSLRGHAGQVCFPGGAQELDESLEKTALREYEEELGSPASDVAIIGSLSPIYVFASNFLVTPFVATVDQAPMFSPDPSEVADVLTPSVAHLLDPRNYGQHVVVRGKLRFRAPHITVHGRQVCRQVWGATAIMLEELLNLIRCATSM